MTREQFKVGKFYVIEDIKSISSSFGDTFESELKLIGRNPWKVLKLDSKEKIPSDIRVYNKEGKSGKNIKIWKPYDSIQGMGTHYDGKVDFLFDDFDLETGRVRETRNPIIPKEGVKSVTRGKAKSGGYKVSSGR